MKVDLRVEFGTGAWSDEPRLDHNHAVPWPVSSQISHKPQIFTFANRGVPRGTRASGILGSILIPGPARGPSIERRKKRGTLWGRARGGGGGEAGGQEGGGRGRASEPGPLESLGRLVVGRIAAATGLRHKLGDNSPRPSLGSPFTRGLFPARFTQACSQRLWGLPVL